MRVIFIVAGLLTGMSSHAQDPLAREIHANTADHCKEFIEADIALDKVYASVLNLHIDDSYFLNKLRVSQKAWIKLRDAQLKAQFPGVNLDANGRSAASARVCHNEKEMAVERTEELALWLRGVPKSNVCAGTVSFANTGHDSRVPPAGACQRFKVTDKKLSQAYQNLAGVCSVDKRFLENLRQTQRAWIQFRDAQVATRFPAENGPAFYGSSYAECVCAEKEFLTAKRAEHLFKWHTKISEENTCTKIPDSPKFPINPANHAPELKFSRVTPLRGPGLRVNSVFARENIVYAGNSSGGLAISADAGSTWINKTTQDGLASDSIRKIRGSGNAVYVATAAGISISTDLGTTWANKTVKNGLGSNSIWDLSVWENRVYAVFGSRWNPHQSLGISSSNDGGNTWSNVFSHGELDNSEVRKIVFAKNKIYVATSIGLFISLDGGKTWTRKTDRDGLVSSDVADVFVSGDVIHLAIEQGFSVSQNAGRSWNYIREPNSAGVSRVFAWSGVTYLLSSRAHRLGDAPVLINSRDGGVTWSEAKSRDETPEDISESIEEKLFYSNEGPFHLVTDDGIMSVPRNPILANVNDVFVANKTVFAATNGGLLVSSDGGQNWTKKTLEDNLEDNVVDVAFSKDGFIFAKTEKETLFSSNGGTTWSRELPTFGLPKFPSSNGDKEAVDSEGTIYKATHYGVAISKDTGRTWTTKNTKDGLGDNSIDAVFAAGCRVFAATPQGLSISSDGGDSWVNRTTQHGFPSDFIEAVTVYGSDIYARFRDASRSHIFLSEDGGNTWKDKAISDETGMSFKLSDASSLWVQGNTIFAILSPRSDGYTFLFSTDGAKTWKRRARDSNITAWPLAAKAASDCTIYAINEGGLYKAEVCSGTNSNRAATAKIQPVPETCGTSASISPNIISEVVPAGDSHPGTPPCDVHFGTGPSPRSMAKTILCPLARGDRRATASLFLNLRFSFLKNDGTITLVRTVDDFLENYQEIITPSLRAELEAVAANGPDDEVPWLKSWVSDFGESALYFGSIGDVRIVNKRTQALTNLKANKAQQLKFWENAAGQNAWCQGAKNAYVVSGLFGARVLSIWKGVLRKKELWKNPPSQVLLGQEVDGSRSGDRNIFFDSNGYVDYGTNSGQGFSCDSCTDGYAKFHTGPFSANEDKKADFEESCMWKQFK